jgi:hypothetical protein
VVTTPRRIAGSSVLMALCLTVSVVGCGDEGRRQRSGVTEDLPCAFSAYDAWTFDVAEGQRVEITLDTLSAATAADFALLVRCDSSSFEGHDERPCSFGPDLGCPATSFTANHTGSCLVGIVFENGVPSCRDATAADYLLDVRIDGVSTVPVLTDEYPASLPPTPAFTESEDMVPCGMGAIDFWRFDVLAGETVVIAADTVDQETTSDLGLYVVCTGLELPSYFYVPCSSPPPSGFGCPLVDFSATSDATCLLAVADFDGCANPAIARYRLGVERDGAPAALTLAVDDLGPSTPLTFTDLEDLTPCGAGVRDLWQFDVHAGETVLIAADTADQDTAADLGLDVACAGLPLYSYARCSFPGPSGFGCPRITFVATSDATCSLTVRDFFSCADASTSRYRLGVARDGVSAALTLTDDDLGPPAPPAYTNFEDVTPCDAGVVDSWRFDVLAGQTVAVAADTIDQETAADLALEVVCGNQTTLIADDELPCSFPPPAFGCPAGSFVAPADGTCTLIIRSFGSCSDESTARYRAGVERDGLSANLTLVGDDEAPAFFAVAEGVGAAARGTRTPAGRVAHPWSAPSLVRRSGVMPFDKIDKQAPAPRP